MVIVVDIRGCRKLHPPAQVGLWNVTPLQDHLSETVLRLALSSVVMYAEVAFCNGRAEVRSHDIFGIEFGQVAFV